MMYKNKFWTTKNGEEIPIRKMDNNHLMNVIYILERDIDRDNNREWWLIMTDELKSRRYNSFYDIKKEDK